MRVFVTGGTGFLGTHVVRAHVEAGDEVRCLVRASSPTLALDGLPVERVEVALDRPAEIRKALEGCDGIQHVAGLFDCSPGGAERMRAVHVDATRHLVEAALDVGVPRFVLCSSTVTVGWGTMERPADEDTPPPDPDRVYGRNTGLRAYHDTKQEGETIALEAARRGLGVVVTYPDYVIGPWDQKPTSNAMILQMARHWIPFWPRGGKCFVDAADCGRAHRAALFHDPPGRRYILGIHNLTYRDFMTRVAHVVGQVPPVMPLPRTATRLVGLAGAALSRVDPHLAIGLDRQVLETTAALRFRDGSRARADLGLSQTPIETSIEAAYRWFVDQGRVPRRGARLLHFR
ncbi:MAG: NAD-dependent epimerase/dehydratase family protein [Deltaproteobacteria bacterium]|nr:NAD-dependent epimerase/dehydratase family protein [Deltaproteobacteria bacterium]